MRRPATARHFWLVLLLVAFTFTRDVHAYLDPGTGSLVFQTAVAALAAAAYALRSYWGKVRTLFRPRQAPDPAVDSNRPQA